MLSRRNFIKLAGPISILSILTLAGCKNTSSQNENSDLEFIETDENNIKNRNWTPTGNSKEFAPGTHFIYTIIPIGSKSNGQIIIPEGYEFVSSETINIKNGAGSSTNAIKYDFLNTVPVIAYEYKNTESDDHEIAYPYSGTPATLEKNAVEETTLTKSKQKQYK